MTVAASTENVLSVTALTTLIKETLEGGFPAVWVKGELSGVKRAPSGHLYFSLKDSGAQLDAIMWKSAAQRLGFEPADGVEVEAFGEITVYVPRGRYQLNARELRPAGLGARLLAFDQLKRRLAAEGLFDSERKRPLPRYPRRIGLVTSAAGAAVRDLVKVLRQRWPSIGIVLAPVRVQGEGAAAEIVAAIDRFNRYTGVDVLIVGRGGGSIEDLWAFNEEPVVRAVANARVPVIAAVGHEVDTTLTDLAADLRASTPSNAAELAVPDRAAVARAVATLRQDLARALREVVVARRRRVAELTNAYHFRRLPDLIRTGQQRVDDALEGLKRALRAMVARARDRMGASDATARLGRATLQAVLARRTALEGYRDRLRALSPRLVLERGYCLASRADGTLLRTAGDVAVGDAVRLEFARGDADARIEAVRHGERDGG